MHCRLQNDLVILRGHKAKSGMKELLQSNLSQLIDVQYSCENFCGRTFNVPYRVTELFGLQMAEISYAEVPLQFPN